MFKYFDIQNRGKVNFDQFYRAMEKTGITMERSVSIKFFFYLYSNINF
jgi:Ca2+-binding EF-hand superfamily protein